MALVPHQKAARRERNMFTSSDDTAMMKQILATHAPDGRDEFSVKPLLQVVEDIFLRATPPGGITDFVQHQGAHQAQLDELEEKAQNGFHETIEILSYSINKISCEMSCKCSGGGDAHATTIAIFHLVSNYTWDEKVVLALAGLAVIYGEFWLVAQLYLTNPLAKAVALLKQLPDIIERADNLKPKFEALASLIRAMMEVAKCIVELKGLPSRYIAPDTPEMLTATAHIPTAVYWTIRGIVVCASQIMGLVGMGHEYTASTTEVWEVSGFVHKVNNIHSLLKKQLELCEQHINKIMQLEAFQKLVSLFEARHINDIVRILVALIGGKDDQQPLFDGSTKKRENLDVLRRRSVLLLISDLKNSLDDLSILKKMYSEERRQPGRPYDQYEVVWLPIADNPTQLDKSEEKLFVDFKEMMPWYSVSHPSLLDFAVIRYIKEVWHFNKKPILVALDQQGKVVNLNAIHMMCIWRSLAFPFTSSREEELWKQETWNIDLLADSIDPMIQSWMDEDKYICLYGGVDMEWIRNFTTTAKRVANDEANIQLEMLYLGKSSPREKVGKIRTLIQSENLSHVLPDLTSIWFFWVRLESMLRSKSKVPYQGPAEKDTIMNEITTMLSFDGSDLGWAVISKGQGKMARDRGDAMFGAFDQFGAWRENATKEGFVPAMIEYLHKQHSESHCNRLILPGTAGDIQERVVCAECTRPMEKFIMYRCCID